MDDFGFSTSSFGLSNFGSYDPYNYVGGTNDILSNTVHDIYNPTPVIDLSSSYQQYNSNYNSPTTEQLISDLHVIVYGSSPSYPSGTDYFGGTMAGMSSGLSSMVARATGSYATDLAFYEAQLYHTVPATPNIVSSLISLAQIGNDWHNNNAQGVYANSAGFFGGTAGGLLAEFGLGLLATSGVVVVTPVASAIAVGVLTGGASYLAYQMMTEGVDRLTPWTPELGKLGFRTNGEGDLILPSGYHYKEFDGGN